MDEKLKKSLWKSKVFYIPVGTLLFLLVLASVFSGSSPATQQPTPTAQAPTISKEEAMNEFQRLMDLSKQSGLVTSYEVDENTSLKIYVSKVWYDQQVQFKKDMIAKFSTLQEAIYGRHRLEVRDGYSNEVVAEVTSFSGSLEVYK